MRPILGVTLVAYIVCDVLLTPLGGLETRPVSHVTGLGFVVLGLLFVGLALAIVSLVMLFRRSPRTAMTAIIAAVLYFPAFLTEQTGHFSSVHVPAAIELVQLIQTAVALILLGVGFWTLRGGTSAARAG